MRTLAEIRDDINKALVRQDVEAIHKFIDEAREHGTRESEAFAENTLGLLANGTGKYDRALEHFHVAMAISQELNDKKGISSTTGHLGLFYTNIGEYPKAIEYYTRARELHEELGNVFGVAGQLQNMGLVYERVGDYVKALECYHQAIPMFEELGNRNHAGGTICNIGVVYQKLGEQERALEHFQRALTIFEEVGNTFFAAQAIGNIGDVYSALNNQDEALVYYQRAFEMHQLRDDSASVVSSAGSIIGLLLKNEDYEKAAELLAVYRDAEIHDPMVRALFLDYDAALDDHLGELEGANEKLLAGLSIAENVGMRDLQRYFHQRIRELAQKRNDFESYIKHNNLYQLLLEETHGKATTQKIAVMNAERGMDVERREREKEKALLYDALPQHVADRMLRGENVSGDQFNAASVLFVDIVGFTTISDSLPPDQVIQLIEQIFSHVDEACTRHNVTKIKTIGDSYMAVTGIID